MIKALELAAAAVALALSAAAPAQDNFPSKPIKWIVPYAPGTSPDSTVRIVAEAMSESLEQTIVVENRTGAAGNMGAQAAARSAPDGCTWVYSASPMASSMRTYKKPGFDVMKDFIHVGRIGTSDLTLITSSESSIKSVRDLIDQGKKKPGALTYASGGIGSPAHMGAELVLETAGVEATHVPFKGANDSVTAVIGKQVDFALAITSVALPTVDSGKLRPLAVTAPQRHARMPNVPTLTEAGLKVTLTSIGGLSVPAGTPAPIVKRLSETLHQALARPDVRAKLDALGGRITPSTPEEYSAALREEIATTEKLMAAAKIEAQ
ncbi:MAG TPA: tripartite tricarboxylate transporter substrate binding protein [Rubrivivax sp.]|nr:tripartite tricarboxylate transporter substrate binding protein [Rubrivivax sp.]